MKKRTLTPLVIIVFVLLSSGATYAVVRFFLLKTVGVNIDVVSNPYEVGLYTDSAGTIDATPIISGSLYENAPLNPERIFNSSKYYLVKGTSGMAFDCYYRLLDLGSLPINSTFSLFFSINDGISWVPLNDGSKLMYGATRTFYAVKFSVTGLENSLAINDIQVKFDIDYGS